MKPVAFICQGNAYMADDIDEYCDATHEPLYSEAQLNQARADALREAAEKFSHNLLGQQNLDARNGVVLAINELRRTPDEIDGGKK